ELALFACIIVYLIFFFSSSRRHTMSKRDWSSDVCSSDLKDETLFNYFKQLFAQVTNPPIDAYREKVVTSELSYLGCEGNLLKPNENALNRIQLAGPVLTEAQLEVIERSRFNVRDLFTYY